MASSSSYKAKPELHLTRTTNRQPRGTQHKQITKPARNERAAPRTAGLGAGRGVPPGLPVNGDVLPHRRLEVLQEIQGLQNSCSCFRLFLTHCPGIASGTEPPSLSAPSLKHPRGGDAPPAGPSLPPSPAPQPRPGRLTHSTSSSAGPPGCPAARARRKGSQSPSSRSRPRREQQRTLGSRPAAAPAAISRLRPAPKCRPGSGTRRAEMAAGRPVDCHCHLAAPCFQTVRGGRGMDARVQGWMGAGIGAEALPLSRRTWRLWCGQQRR